MSGKEKVLAIIKDVGFVCRDTGHPCLFFTVYTSESSASLQIIDHAKALSIIENSGVYDVKNLEGKPCWVDIEGNSISFNRLWKNN